MTKLNQAQCTLFGYWLFGLFSSKYWDEIRFTVKLTRFLFLFFRLQGRHCWPFVPPICSRPSCSPQDDLSELQVQLFTFSHLSWKKMNRLRHNVMQYMFVYFLKTRCRRSSQFDTHEVSGYLKKLVCIAPSKLVLCACVKKTQPIHRGPPCTVDP